MQKARSFRPKKRFSPEMYMKKIYTSVEHIRKSSSMEGEIGIILGSGLGSFHEQLTHRTEIEYQEIPNFPIATVQGHAGKLVMGELNGKKLIVMSGRFHYYEGYSLMHSVFPVRVMSKLGVKKLIVTNAAGGINTSFVAGDLMLIDDHINLMADNPLMGMNFNDLGPRFPDMTKAYTPRLKEIAMKASQETGVELKRGIYLATTGPSYETPAEIRMMRVLGADAVGMSTVPEVITARHLGLEILGISCITNMAAGILDQPLSHQEVFETAEKSKGKFVKLLSAILANM